MKTVTRSLALTFLALLAFGQAACGLKQVGAKTTADIMYDTAPVIDREEDVELAEQASLGVLKMLEGLYIQNPKDKEVLFLLTRAYAGYAFGFTENKLLATKDSDPAAYKKAKARAKRFYSRARRYGLELLSLNSKFRKAQEGSLDEFQDALQSFGQKDVEDLFWAGFAWGNYLNFNKDSVEAIAEMPRIKAVMDRVLELNEDYYYGGADLFMGAFYGNRPKMLGGDPKLSKEHFEKAMAISNGKNLMAPVTMAQFYAVQVQDLKLFEKLLNEVIQADAAVLPEQRLMNELAKIRAKILMEKKAQYFSKVS